MDTQNKSLPATHSEEEQPEREYAQFTQLRVLRAATDSASGEEEHRAAKNAWFLFRSQIFEEHKNLIFGVLRKKGLSVTNDQIQEGAIGLLRAIDGADPGFFKVNNTFATYAYHCIESQFERERSYRNAKKRQAHVVSADTLQLVPVSDRITRMRLPGYNDDPDPGVYLMFRTTLAETISSHYPSPEERVIREDDGAYLRECLRFLTHRQREIIERRFGFDGSDGQSLEQVAGVFGVTKERIRQIEGKSLDRLRRAIEQPVVFAKPEEVSDKPNPEDDSQCPLPSPQTEHVLPRGRRLCAILTSTFAPKLRSACIRIGISQAMLAHHIGCSPQMLSKLFFGRIKRNNSIPEKLCTLFRLSIEEFLNMDDRTLARLIIEKIILPSLQDPTSEQPGLGTETHVPSLPSDDSDGNIQEQETYEATIGTHSSVADRCSV